MDSDPPRPSRAPEGLSVPPRAESSQSTAPGSRARSSSQVTAGSRRSPHLHPATPSAEEETAADYFESLGRSASVRSRTSARSSTRPPTTAADAGTIERPTTASSLRRPSVRIRRNSNASLSSTSRMSRAASPETSAELLSGGTGSDDYQGGRPRSISVPERGGHLAADNPTLSRARHSRRAPQQVAMPRLTEEGARPSMAELGMESSMTSPAVPPTDEVLAEEEPYEERPDTAPSGAKRIRRRRGLTRIFSRANAPASGSDVSQPSEYPGQSQHDEEFDERLVNLLDIIDPEVQTLSTLTNVQNSLFVPDLGGWLNRRPTYTLSLPDPEAGRTRPHGDTVGTADVPTPVPEDETPLEEDDPRSHMQRSSTITSRLTESHFAALPHGTTLDGWTPEEKAELDDYVRHMLHSRRSRFKRSLKGFGQYVRRPLGFFVTLYATLITLFGLAWVLFLIGWIYVGEEQVYAIHVIDSVLVALFAIMGDGLAPFRAVDTYHLSFVIHYTRMIEKAKKGRRPRSKLQKRMSTPEPRSKLQKRGAVPEVRLSPVPTVEESRGPQLSMTNTADTGPVESLRGQDTMSVSSRGEYGISTNDLAMQQTEPPVPFPDLEEAKTTTSMEEEEVYLTPKQQARLEHHKMKLAKSHSFYKPEATFTHYSFPLSYLIAIVILLDCHSCLQISLGACTWGIDYHTRPFALTTVILCVSITCNITAGLVITTGDRKTRKKDVVKLLDRQELTGDAIKHIEKKKQKEQSVGHSETETSIQQAPEIDLGTIEKPELNVFKESEKRDGGLA